MASSVQVSQRYRESFGKIGKVVDIPHLIEVQKISYDKFLQAAVAQEDRENIGLHGVFSSVFPIRDFKGTSELAYLGYVLGVPVGRRLGFRMRNGSLSVVVHRQEQWYVETLEQLKPQLKQVVKQQDVLEN